MPTLAVTARVALLAVVQENHPRDSVTLADALTRARAGRPQTGAAAAVVERGRGAGRVATLVPNPSVQLETDEFAPTRKLSRRRPRPGPSSPPPALAPPWSFGAGVSTTNLLPDARPAS